MFGRSLVPLVALGLLLAGCSAANSAEDSSKNCAGHIALTYDDGPTEWTQDLTNALVEHDMVATYFLIGGNVEEDPESVLHAKDRGMVLGTHTFSHPDMRGLNRQDQVLEIQLAEDAVRIVTGEEPVLWRPPYSYTDKYVELAVQYAGSRQIMWDLDSLDWEDPTLLPDSMRAVQDGDIVVLHDLPTAPTAVSDIASALHSKGLCAVGLTPEGKIDRT